MFKKKKPLATRSHLKFNVICIACTLEEKRSSSMPEGGAAATESVFQNLSTGFPPPTQPHVPSRAPVKTDPL